MNIPSPLGVLPHTTSSLSVPSLASASGAERCVSLDAFLRKRKDEGESVGMFDNKSSLAEDTYTPRRCS